MPASFSFPDANVLVFGGTSGINLGIAEAFVRAGARVGVVGRDPEKAGMARDRLADFGKAFAYTGDVRDYDAVTSVYARFADDAGPVDVMVAGAAGNFPAPVIGMSANGFKAVVDIDLLGTFNCCRAGFEHLRKPGASIIAVSAPQAQVPMAMQAHVCAAKAGVEMLVRSLAVEWGGAGVRVNAVVPGPIDGTEGMARLAPTDALRKKVAKGVPLGRFGTPADVAEPCLFLASDAAAYISGAILPADGGWLAASARLEM